MVRIDILFQLAVPACENGFEAVLDLGIDRNVPGVKGKSVVGDALPVTAVDVLSCQGEEETHGAETVGEGMENVQENLLPLCADTVKEAVLIGKIEGFERLERLKPGILFNPVEIPPESPCL